MITPKIWEKMEKHVPNHQPEPISTNFRFCWCFLHIFTPHLAEPSRPAASIRCVTGIAKKMFWHRGDRRRALGTFMGAQKKWHTKTKQGWFICIRDWSILKLRKLIFEHFNMEVVEPIHIVLTQGKPIQIFTHTQWRNNRKPSALRKTYLNTSTISDPMANIVWTSWTCWTTLGKAKIRLSERRYNWTQVLMFLQSLLLCVLSYVWYHCVQCCSLVSGLQATWRKNNLFELLLNDGPEEWIVKHFFPKTVFCSDETQLQLPCCPSKANG